MSDSFPTTISGLLETHETIRVEHHVLNKQVDGLRSSRDLDEVTRLKTLRCNKKTAMQTIASRLASFPEATLRQELGQLKSRLNLCNTGGRHASSGELRERLGRDIALIEEAIPESEALRLVHSGQPQTPPMTAVPQPVAREAMAATG